MLYLLDTNHLSLLERGGAEGERIRQRILAVGEENIVVSVVSYEEQLRGWLAYMAKQRSIESQVFGYEQLQRQLRNYCTLTLLPFDAPVAEVFQSLWITGKKINAMDLKIASTAIAHNATVLTCNTKDFLRIPGIRMEDWSIEI
jgi:tRNA(fMet)-specific endonuclease VapC